MRVYHTINEFKGIVQHVSKDKTEITISLPKGGRIKARNEGFEAGDNVCFIMNNAGTKVVKVFPKLVADLTAIVGEDPTLAGSLIERPDNEEEEDFNEYEIDDPNEPIIIEEDYDESRDGTAEDSTKEQNEAKFAISDSD